MRRQTERHRWEVFEWSSEEILAGRSTSLVCAGKLYLNLRATREP